MQPGLPRLVAVDFPRLHEPFQLLRAMVVDQLAPLRTIDRDDRVPVADSSDVASVFAHRFADLRGKLRQIAHGRIFLENDLAVLFRIDLQRVAFADTECPADLLGDDDAAEVVDAAHDSCCFHISLSLVDWLCL